MHKFFSILSDHSDEKLLSLLSKGNEDAFTTIYERYHKLLYTLAYKYLKSTNSAEDTVQQVFLKLWESRTMLNSVKNLRNFLYTITKNHILNEIRNNSIAIEKNYEIAQATPEFEDELLAKIEEKELMKHFYDAIEELPTQKRLVCIHKLKGNLSNQEIAGLMGITVPTVKTHYAQAIKMLYKQLHKLFVFLLLLFTS